jgi:hypothetical protein
MRNLFLNHLNLVCFVLYAVAMAAVDFGAHQIVGRFGIVAGLAVIAGMYGTARYFERRR